MAGQGAKRRIAGPVLAGVASLLLGLQFAVGALVAHAAWRWPKAGVPVAAAAVLGMYLLAGLQASLMTAAVAAALHVAVFLKLGRAPTAALSAGVATLAAAAGLLDGPGLMGFTKADLAILSPAWSGWGLSPDAIDRMIDLLVYISPGSGAVQIAAGSAAATALVFSLRPGTDRGDTHFHLGLGPAWLLILFLAAAFLPVGVPPEARHAVHNILLFMSVPYFAVGLSVAGMLVRTSPALLFAAAGLAVFAPPAATGAVVLTGVLDTWFDFRKKLSNRLEGKDDEGNPH
jgi:hypothetical protein